MHDGEDTFFHLTSILGAEYDKSLFFEVQCDTCICFDTFNGRVGRLCTTIKYHVIGLAEFFELLERWADQHIVHKQRMVGSGTDDSNLKLVIRIPACKSIEYIYLAACVQIVNSDSVILIERI